MNNIALGKMIAPTIQSSCVKCGLSIIVIIQSRDDPH